VGEVQESAGCARAQNVDGLLVELQSPVHHGREGGVAAKVIEPGIADKGLVAEKSVVDSAGKHLERPVVGAKIAQLARLVVKAFGVAEGSLHQLFAGAQAFFTIAFKKCAHRRQEKATQTPWKALLVLAQDDDGFRHAVEHGKNQRGAVAEVVLRSGEGPLVVAEHEVGVVEGGGDARVEAACFVLSEQGRLQKAAVAGDVAQAGEQFRVGAASGGQVEETLQGFEAAALIDLQVGIEVMSERKIR